MTEQLEGTRLDEQQSLPTDAEDHCQLSTFDRKSGRVHEVQMRFARRGDTIYMLADEGARADWVQNIIKNPEASLRIGNETVSGMGRVVTSHSEDEQARRLLAEKYEGWRDGQELSGWARTALPVAIEHAPRIH
jgi:deazaflavin-dependent oxidoreductase (nitroreductase family)